MKKLSNFISFSKHRCFIGILLGILSISLLYLTRNSYIGDVTRIPNGHLLGIPFFVCFTLLGAIQIRNIPQNLSLLLTICWTIVCAIACLLWSICVLECISLWNIPLHNYILTVLVFFIFSLSLYLFTKNWKGAVNATVLIQFCVAAANSCVWQFRGKEILFNDLSCLGTAMLVVGEFKPIFSLRMAIALVILVLTLFAQFSIPTPTPICKKKRTAAFLWSAVLSVCLLASIWKMPTKTYNKEPSLINGFYVNFILSARDAIIKVPDGYSSEALSTLEAQYPASSADSTSVSPNIIVIMNESFADFRVLGENFHCSEPITPFMDALRDNTIKGYALSSVYGGSTANSEYEFLTGGTMGFLPTSSIPYQQYISENIFSVPWYLKQMGYSTFATHPYKSTGWSRTTIYPYMGFDSFTFEDSYPQKDYIRSFLSDREMYEYVFERLSHASESPQMIFGVTMQNHGGYNYDGTNFDQNIKLENYVGSYEDAEQYLSLIQDSDQALEYFISALSNYEEDTIVLFFGDHYPGLSDALYNEIHGEPLDTLEKQMLKYTVPFMIWANYDIPEYEIPQTSLNYLSLYLLDAANIPYNGYFNFLSELEDAIPAINAHGYYSLEQDAFIPFEYAEGIEKEWLNRYEIIQYNNLFDQEARSSSFFGQYLP